MNEVFNGADVDIFVVIFVVLFEAQKIEVLLWGIYYNLKWSCYKKNI